MAPQPKKKPKQLLKPVTATPGHNPTNGVRVVPGALKPPGTTAMTTRIYGQVPAGRPVSNLGKYLLKSTPETPEGVEILNSEPDMLQRVNDQYLKAFQLPPSLQPKYLRKPEVLERGATGRATKISRGMRNPRSLHGG